MKKLRINVQGRVQGVGFRFTTKMLADQLGICGRVKNEENGSVTIEAIGDGVKLQAFLDKVKTSPTPAGKVREMTIVEDLTIKDTDSFDVTY